MSVQDAGAQLAATWLDLAPRQRVLDACAAPGGKTGHLLELGRLLDRAADVSPGMWLERPADDDPVFGRRPGRLARKLD